MDNTTINLTDENIKKQTKTKPTKTKKPMDPKKKKILCITTLVVGLIMLAVGAVFLVLNLTKGSQAQDGEYLISAGEWALDLGDCAELVDESDPAEESTECSDEPSVVWKFTEVGKGTLTTDGGKHNYDFIWALEDGTLKIQTNWLYELENEYTYSLDQKAKTLTLTNDKNDEYIFVALPAKQAEQ